MSSNTVYDVIVIGGGPAGMMAAATAAHNGKYVLLVEKNGVLGKKLSVTGGGRCNILNHEPDVRKLLSNYSNAEKFLYSAFAQFGMQSTWDFFHKHNLPLVVEARQRAFPQSMKAADVTETMRKFCLDNGVEIRLNTGVNGFLSGDGEINAVSTTKGDFVAQHFILATGGASHPETGSTGEGLRWLKKLGHTVHEPNPNIVPLVVKENWVKNISGNKLKDAKIVFSGQKQKVTKRGDILFTHFGLSGPTILNSAKEVKELLKDGEVGASIDCYPDIEMGKLRQDILDIFATNKNKDLKNILKAVVPEGLSRAIYELLPEEMATKKVHSISQKERYHLADLLKNLPVTVTGTKGLDWAVVSDGGVPLTEVDTRTMRSKVVKNLSLVGDTLHISRPSGGYSLQLCWTTGFVAGNNL